jgi:hypothetical protein
MAIAITPLLVNVITQTRGGGQEDEDDGEWIIEKMENRIVGWWPVGE